MTDPSAPNANTETVESVDVFSAFVDADLADPDAAVWSDPVWDMSEYAWAQHAAKSDPRGIALLIMLGGGTHETAAKREAWRVASETARRRLSQRDRIYLRRVERGRSARRRVVANRAPRTSRRASLTSSAATTQSPGSPSGSNDPEPSPKDSAHRTPPEVRP
jgi:hypothetical protein